MRPLKLTTVLAATDLDPSSNLALESGHRLARAAGAALHVLHVDESARAAVGGAPSRDSRSAVESALRRAGIPERDAKVHVVGGSPADAIRAVAQQIGADLVVVGPHRHPERSAPAHRLGGTARAIVVGASAPCLVTVRELRLPLERVLVAVDLSDTARGALLVALSWASALRTASTDDRATTLTVLHVGGAERGGETRQATLAHELESLRRSAGDWAGVRIEALDAHASPGAADAIAEVAQAQRADLVVLGTRGAGLDEVSRLGSVSASVVELSQTTVLLVPPSVWRMHAEEPRASEPLRDRVSEASIESFPASDSPSWSGGMRLGPPA